MTSILITGAGGLIGRQVVCAAENAGHGVTALVRKPCPGVACNVIRHDLRFPLGNLPPADWIFHLAGAYAGAGDEEFRDADWKMANNIIDWGLGAGIKNWVFASAAEVYGEVRGVADEGAHTLPVIPYGHSKLMVERVLTEKTKDLANCRLVIFRIAEVYGSEARLIRELVARLKGGFCPWPGTGRVPVSFVHVDDVARAFLCAVSNAPIGISIYNVADDLPVTWEVFLRRAAQICGAKPPVFLPKALVHLYAACDSLARRATGRAPLLTRHAMRLLTTSKVLSNSRLKRELGFQPRYPSYTEGLEEALHGLSHDA